MPTIAERVLTLAEQIQQIPAPTFLEAERARFVCSGFEAEGLADVSLDETGNVFARFPGQDPHLPPLVVSAHLDTVFPLETSLEINRSDGRIRGPGIGDNAVALAGLFGLCWMLKERPRQPAGDTWFVANVAEEGLGNLRGMRAVVDRFGSSPAAYLVVEGTALGHVYHRGLSVRRYRVRFETRGGHSWGHFGRASAVHELARFIVALTAIEIPEDPRTTFNAGVISGGTTVNTIAPWGELQLDLRSEDPDALERLVREVEVLARSFASDELTVLLDVIGDRPGGQLPSDHPLPALAARSLAQLGYAPQFKIGSTDANIPLSRGIPAICIGITQGGGGHSVDEYILTGPLADGLQHLLEVTLGAWEI